MSLKALCVLFFIIGYTVTVCHSECSEYILFTRETHCGNRHFFQSKSLNEIKWDTDCLQNSTNLLWYDEIIANTSCVLELTYQVSLPNCTMKILPVNRSTHKFIPDNKTFIPLIHPFQNLAYIQIHGIDLNKTLNRYCEFSHPNYVTNDEYTEIQFINFRHCKGDYRNTDNSLGNKDIIIVLKNDNVASNDTKTSDEDIKNVRKLNNKEYLNLHLKSNNESDCNKLLKLNITNGNIINSWTPDEEQMLMELYNSTLVELKILNCINNIAETIESDNQINKSLDLNIVFNRPNNTVLIPSIIKELNKVKTKSTKIAILDCLYANPEETKRNNSKLLLECTITDIDAINTNVDGTTKMTTLIQTQTTENPENIFETPQIIKDSFEPYKYVTTKSNTETSTPELSTTESTAIQTFPLESKEIETTEFTTGVSQSETTTQVITEKEKQTYQTEPSTSVTIDSNTLGITKSLKSNEFTTTESNKQNYQLGMKGNQDQQTTDEDAYLDPIVYVFITLVSISVISGVTIFALRKWKAPRSYHLTATRDWPVVEDS